MGIAIPWARSGRGFHSIDPGILTRETIIDMLSRVEPQAILDVVPHGTPQQIAKVIKEYCDAGLRVPKILDYSSMAGIGYAAGSAAQVREAEDEFMRLCGSMV